MILICQIEFQVFSKLNRLNKILKWLMKSEISISIFKYLTIKIIRIESKKNFQLIMYMLAKLSFICVILRMNSRAMSRSLIVTFESAKLHMLKETYTLESQEAETLIRVSGTCLSPFSGELNTVSQSWMQRFSPETYDIIINSDLWPYRA